MITATFPTYHADQIQNSFRKSLFNSLQGLNNALKSKKLKKSNFKKQKSLTDNLLIDSTVIFMDPMDAPIGNPAKRPAGTIVAYDSENEYTSSEVQFARRENSSPVFVPVGQDVNIDSLVASWTNDFMISYLVIMPVYYGGYLENDLDLVEATDSLNGDVLNSLADVDQNYATMDSTTNITLKFKNNFGEVPTGFVREYVLITTGQYENVRESENLLLSGNQNVNIPSVYKLYQNYPNPFNPLTTIKFDLPKEGFVSIKIYDILGKEVYSFKEIKQGGSHQISFDGNNFASGVYFYKIEAGNFVQTKRMVLIK